MRSVSDALGKMWRKNSRMLTSASPVGITDDALLNQFVREFFDAQILKYEINRLSRWPFLSKKRDVVQAYDMTSFSRI